MIIWHLHISNYLCIFEPESLADKTLSTQDKARLFIRYQIITSFYTNFSNLLEWKELEWKYMTPPGSQSLKLLNYKQLSSFFHPTYLHLKQTVSHNPNHCSLSRLRQRFNSKNRLQHGSGLQKRLPQFWDSLCIFSLPKKRELRK